MNKVKNIWKYIVLLGVVLMVVNILVLICLMPFYGWTEPLPYWVEALCKTWLILLLIGGVLGLITYNKPIINEIKDMLE
jgi:hypothetical protein